MQISTAHKEACITASSFLLPELARLKLETVDVPSLEAFKARLDVALGSLVGWLATLNVAGGVKLDDI